VASQKASRRNEDPWLCVPDFGQVCLSQTNYEPLESAVNSGMYLTQCKRSPPTRPASMSLMYCVPQRPTARNQGRTEVF